MTSLLFHAPAKINLTLRVLGRRADGFHELETLMVKLPALADVLEFTPAEAPAFTCDDPTVPADERNLVVRAARAFEQATSIPWHVRISLQKNIPHGAGLGGGSSDAAATLLALNHLAGQPLGLDRLSELAAAIGSDVPFFLTPGAASCSGRGEKLRTVEDPPPLRVLLLKPAFGVSTPDAYGRWATATELPGISYAPQPLPGITLVNDLERPVFSKHLFLAELKHWLLQREECAAALMCGSGSTTVAVLRNDANPGALAEAARRELDPTLWHWSGLTGPMPPPQIAGLV
jgi:4-diphosphocytidyl-2-C-methyl-D-erythritol kinase